MHGSIIRATVRLDVGRHVKLRSDEWVAYDYQTVTIDFTLGSLTDYAYSVLP